MTHKPRASFSWPPRFRRRLENVLELLDGPLDDPEALADNLRDLARVNRWLGGSALSLRAIRSLVTGFHAAPRIRGAARGEQPLRILDVGTGGADIPLSLLRWAARTGHRLEVEAVDARPEIVEAARWLVGAPIGLRLAVADGERLPYGDRSVDIAHVSLVTHHLEPAAVIDLLRELRRVSRLGVVVNDLDRGLPAWVGAWVLSRAFTRNVYTRHDAPLSVRRAYRPAELSQLAARSGLLEVCRFHGPFGHRYSLGLVRAARAPRRPRRADVRPEPDPGIHGATPVESPAVEQH